MKRKAATAAYDASRLTPAIRCSICTGEQVVGFLDNATGRFQDVALITCDRDLAAFRREYGVEGDIRKIY